LHEDSSDSTTPLKPASCGYILPKNFHRYKTNDTNVFLDASNDFDRKILTNLNVRLRDIYSFTFEDVEFPKIWDCYYYFNFLKEILNNPRIVQNLRNYRCFPNAITRNLKKITELYDYNNLVFRTVFGGDSDVFLHNDFSTYAHTLSHIGFKNKINQVTFKECAEKIEELQEEQDPPTYAVEVLS